MAILTGDELAHMRQVTERDRLPHDHTKAPINAVVQALEDWYEAERPAVGALMEAAAPGVLSTLQKRRVAGHFIILKGAKELI